MFRVRWAKSVLKEDQYFTTMVIPETKSKTAGAKVTARVAAKCMSTSRVDSPTLKEQTYSCYNT